MDSEAELNSMKSNNKIDRVLRIYSRLMNGYIVRKSEEAQRFGVNERSIQRDIEDIRLFMDHDSLDSGITNTVIYDRKHNGYRLEQIYDMKLSNSEILAICKILLDSRAFTKKQMTGIISRLIDCCVPKVNHNDVKGLIRNEEFHYVEPRHRSDFIDKMWDIGKAILERSYIEICYQRLKNKAVVKRMIKPVALMFSDYYFYVTAFIDDEAVKEDFDIHNDPFPTIYRIDRIKEYRILNKHFDIPYSNRFEEGEFRKRIQFMYGGKLQRVRFTYCGPSIEAVLDRLPTAVCKAEKDGTYTVTAEVFGKGIEMWLKSQGCFVKDIEIR